MHRRVCPLYSFDQGGHVRLVGSAVPFKEGHIAFLITATHVCLTPNRQSIPLFTLAGSGPRVLQGMRLAWEYQRGKTPDADLTLIALSCDEFHDLQSEYAFSESSDIAMAKEKQPFMHYMIVGYPATRNRVSNSDTSLRPIATHLVTGDVRPVYDLRIADKFDSSHFAIYLSHREIKTAQGSSFRVPKPNGMSGGGVWRLELDPRTRLISSFYLVGIGIEYHKCRSIFLATRIQLAAPLANDLLDLVAGKCPAGVVPLPAASQ